MNLNNSIGAVSQSHNVFVYGTLLSDEVVKVLLNRLPRSSPAILSAQLVSFPLSALQFLNSKLPWPYIIRIDL